MLGIDWLLGGLGVAMTIVMTRRVKGAVASALGLI